MAPRQAAGVIAGLATAAIWGSWAVMTRLAVIGPIDPWDTMLLRYLPAAIVTLPILFLRGGITRRGVAGVAWPAVLVCLATGSVPFTLLAFHGFTLAPAADHGAIGPAATLLFTLAFGSVVLGERLERRHWLGIAVLVAGLVAMGAARLAGLGQSFGLGHAMFIAASLLWACFTIAARAWRVPALTATALLCVGGCALFAPYYFARFGLRLAAVPLGELVVHALYQGLISGVLSIITYTRTIEHLGAGMASLFTALVPALTTLLAWPVLGEQPGVAQIGGVALVTVGMVIAIRGGAIGPGRAAAISGQAAGTLAGSKP